MAAPKLDLKAGPRIRAFRAIEAILREDPVLSNVVRTWSTWNGEGGDAMELAAGMLPHIGLDVLALPNEVMGEGRSAANVGVRVEIATAGLVVEDYLNLWDAVEDALVRGKAFRGTNVLCFLQSEGCYAHRVVSPGIDAFKSPGNPPTQFLAGAGVVVMKVSRPA